MPNYKPFRELKRLAKVQLQGKYGTMIGALILQELLVLFATGILSMMIPGTDTLSNILYYILTFIVQFSLSKSSLWDAVQCRRYFLLF